jgi:hypothetical protein
LYTAMAFRIAGECVKLRRNACRYTSWTKLTLSRLLYRTSRTKCIAAAYGSSLKYNYSIIKLQLTCNFYILLEYILLWCAYKPQQTNNSLCLVTINKLLLICHFYSIILK